MDRDPISCTGAHVVVVNCGFGSTILERARRWEEFPLKSFRERPEQYLGLRTGRFLAVVGGRPRTT